MPVALSLLVSLPSWSADFDKGLATYNRGDYVNAIREWRPLVEQGYAMAQNNLGVMYGLGDGVVQNYVTAHMWGNIARANGYDSGKLLDALEQLMSKDQIAETQQRASDRMANQNKNC